MGKTIRNFLIVLGVSAEAGLVLFFLFAEIPVSRTACLFLWCLLTAFICHLAAGDPGRGKGLKKRHAAVHHEA